MTTHDTGLESLPDAVVVVDADHVVRAANALAGRLVHRRAEDLVGRDVSRVVPLRDAGGTDWWRCSAIVGTDIRLLPRIPERVLHLHITPSAPRPVAVTGRRIADDAGRLDRLVVSLRRAERRVVDERAHSDLISTASHELRAPLTSVRGFTKTLLARWDKFDDATRRQMIATIDEDADRVTRLLTELLDVSRIDAGRLPLHRQIVTLHMVVAPLARRFAVEHGDTLALDVADDLPDLMVDPDRIAQVVSNLLDNAVKYGAPPVAVGAHAVGDQVQISVSDQGGHIPERHLDQIFAKYFRGDRVRPAGSGLGLYISRGIITAHGGRIWATSAPDTGTQFVFALPTAAAQLGPDAIGGPAADAPRRVDLM